MQRVKLFCIAGLCFLLSNIIMGQGTTYTDYKIDEKSFNKVGKGICKIEKNILVSQDAYASIGEYDWEDYRFSFEARTPKSEEQVQIWFGFREEGRNERYLVGIKGGLQNDIEIGRMGLMGDDAFLGIRNLNFDPQCGEWYKVNVEVCSDRIRIFLNDESIPRIDIIDKNSKLLPAGKIALGGSWIKTEFRNLSIEPLSANHLDEVAIAEYNYYLTPEQKEEKRKNERPQFKPVKIKNVQPLRTVVSLDGLWLFKPGYEIIDESDAYSAKKSDEDWHLIDVPNFWNPSRIWNHGETFMEERFPKGISDTYFQKETDRCANYTFDYEKTSIGWYRQWIDLPEDINNKHLQLSFEAVSKVAEVYVNGVKATTNIGMFKQIDVDITELVKPGKNLIAVKVMRDFVEDMGDQNEIATIAVTVEVTNQMLRDIPHGFFRDNPSGIWQPVRLVMSNPLKIEDVYIKPGLYHAEYDVTVKNHGSKKAVFSIQTKINDEADGSLLAINTERTKYKLKPGEERVITYEMDELTPKRWSPETPNLYNFKFSLHSHKSDEMIDETTIRSGFRTFETKGDYFYLNNKRYWIRGANHTPHALGINDKALAERTFDFYHQANIAVTRSHTIPYSRVWLEAADKKGVGVSFEGTWPWLMIGKGEESIPNEQLLKVWKTEWLTLLKKYRNHPSLLYWTINNEMNFTHRHNEKAIAEKKMGIVSDVVKGMREVDPTRPICFDSGYNRKSVAYMDNDDRVKPDSSFYVKFDDGDIDDGHNYSGWYKGTIFNNFVAKPFEKRKTSNRPLISQEWSTGYPNTETGHHTRNYLWQHQNIQTHVGNHGYPFGNPKYSLQNNAFLTSELAEAIRRTHDQLAGMHHFSSITWFRNVYDAQRMEPYPTYYRMKNSLSPVLVSAELFGRHFYAGECLPARFCIVNDQVNGEKLEPTKLRWEITYADNRVVSSGEYAVPAVKHYSREWINPEIIIPDNFKGDRLDGKLRIYLNQNGKQISWNEYDLMFAKKSWLQVPKAKTQKIVLVDLNQTMARFLDANDFAYQKENNLIEALELPADIYIISGLETKEHLSEELVNTLAASLRQGKRLLLLNSGEHLTQIFPANIKGYLKKELETVNIDIPESDVFRGIEHMDLRYFNNNKREVPMVCKGLMQVNEDANVECLAAACQHRYARSKDRRTEMLTMKGFPIVKFNDGGSVIISEMQTSKHTTDPVMGKLLGNMLNDLSK